MKFQKFSLRFGKPADVGDMIRDDTHFLPTAHAAASLRPKAGSVKFHLVPAPKQN
jgi:RNase adaptor protein for sRNA GlmZ degradation